MEWDEAASHHLNESRALLITFTCEMNALPDSLTAVMSGLLRFTVYLSSPTVSQPYHSQTWLDLTGLERPELIPCLSLLNTNVRKTLASSTSSFAKSLYSHKGGTFTTWLGVKHEFTPFTLSEVFLSGVLGPGRISFSLYQQTYIF